MKPESQSRRYFGITRSKGKMYELGLPEDAHIAVPEGVEPAALLPLTVGTLVDASAALNDASDVEASLPDELQRDVDFAASFFDAYLSSRFNTRISHELTLFASAAYFVGRRPGSSFVLARKLTSDGDDALERLAVWALSAKWGSPPDLTHQSHGQFLAELADALMGHFNEGLPPETAFGLLERLRKQVYSSGTSREVVLIEVASAVIRLRLASSAWRLLPRFSELDAGRWSEAIRRTGFPKELWPSQRLLGRAGIFAGRSGVIQMPTSAGKTRSVEIILRSAFLAERTRVAVLVAPFRALCHEIATSLRYSFKGEDVRVNELSDALQLDFTDQLAELLGQAAPTTRYILVLTPEKFLYALRQTPTLATHIGAVVYDEGHQFDTGPRGITYELLLTEIKGLLGTSAQTVLISAVIKNAVAVGGWLIGEDPNVVDGTGLLSTARSVAFASWSERLGQLQFFESGSYDRRDYFVPRIIEEQLLERRGRERTDRFFPKKGDAAWKDVSLYLGIRLAPNGAVAVFCGKKDTASGLAERAVEIYDRGFNLPPPADASDPSEVRRLVHLAVSHFGEQSVLARAASLGVFVHHGTTPQGLRLSIEHAMQSERIKVVLCTSTLAQGVNLPIRYLIVSGINQGAERIKTRDFQNLIGRAGRAGMHTEGLVLFADPRVFDDRRSEAWRMKNAVGLLEPKNSEETSSSLLELLTPLRSETEQILPIPLERMLDVYFLRGADLESWATKTAVAYQRLGFDARFLVREISKRKRLLTAVYSYLMASRDGDNLEEYKGRVRVLAASTLAYALSEEGSKNLLIRLFELTAEHIDRVAPQTERQAAFAKTLLGVDDAAAVEAWVRENVPKLRQPLSGQDWLHVIWPLFQAIVDNKLLTSMEPDGLAMRLAEGWIAGMSYERLIEVADQARGTKPWGENRRRLLTDGDVLEYLEGCLGFECPLVLAAVTQFLFGETGLNTGEAASLNLFQKSLKYGLAENLAISTYESGFADRHIAQVVSNRLHDAGYEGAYFGPALTNHRDILASVLEEYPTYFRTVLDAL